MSESYATSRNRLPARYLTHRSPPAQGGRAPTTDGTDHTGGTRQPGRKPEKKSKVLDLTSRTPLLQRRHCMKHKECHPRIPNSTKKNHRTQNKDFLCHCRSTVCVRQRRARKLLSLSASRKRRAAMTSRVIGNPVTQDHAYSSIPWARLTATPLQSVWCGAKNAGRYACD